MRCKVNGCNRLRIENTEALFLVALIHTLYFFCEGSHVGAGPHLHISIIVIAAPVVIQCCGKLSPRNKNVEMKMRIGRHIPNYTTHCHIAQRVKLQYFPYRVFLAEVTLCSAFSNYYRL